ncbi:MAG: GspH/FimT family pseudopilin [Rhodanobacter sp.]
MTNTSTKLRGFSLLELMITISVMAILLAVALPSFRDAIHRNQVSSSSNELLASLAYARTEAVTRGQLVSMCPGTKAAGCTAAGQAFDAGWIVYTYPAGAASANKAYVAGAPVLRSVDPRSGVSIQSHTTEVITFGQQGQLHSATITPLKLDFVTCFRNGTTGTGSSTTSVPGAELRINGSGSVSTYTWPVGSACTP